MAFVLNDGQGTLHRNDKHGVEARPDYRGDLMLDGKLLEISAWLKQGKNGKWMSLSVQPKREREAAPTPTPTPVDVDSDTPF